MSDQVSAPKPALADGPDGGPGPRSPRWRGLVSAFFRRREASILLIAIALVIYFQVASFYVFLTEGNLVTVSQYVAAPAIIAVGEVFLLVSGEIDLSVGNVYTLAPFLMHFAVADWGFPVVPGIIVALLLSALVGAINGFVTVRLHVPAFVTTLGMLFTLEGITLVTSHAYPAEIPEGAAGPLQSVLGAAPWSEIIWAGIIVAAFVVVFNGTRWGLHTVAAGGNLLGAAESGIRVGRIKIGNFMITSTLGGFAGILEAFRINSIDPQAGGTEMMFSAVAAAVIGGTALAGGSGTVLGALFGALVLGILKDGFNLLGVDANTYFLILGVAILVAMVSNVYLTRLRRAGRT